jgi:hypothetical protein
LREVIVRDLPNDKRADATAPTGIVDRGAPEGTLCEWAQARDGLARTRHNGI